MSEILTEIEIISIAQSALKAELTVTAIYEKLAEEFRGSKLADKLSKFAHAEEGHANFWRIFLEKREVDTYAVKLIEFRIAFRARADIIWFIKRA